MVLLLMKVAQNELRRKTNITKLHNGSCGLNFTGLCITCMPYHYEWWEDKTYWFEVHRFLLHLENDDVAITLVVYINPVI